LLLYIYALSDVAIEMDSLTGVASEPLILVPAAYAIAVCGWMEQLPPLDRDSLVAQDRLVRALHARADALLPMRFGTSAADVNTAQRAVDAFGAKLRERFDLVRGREQMTLRVLGATGATGAVGATGAAEPASPKLANLSTEAKAGARYLAERSAKAVPSRLAPLIDALRPLQRAMHIEPGRDADVIGTVYHLIDRGTATVYCRAVEHAATRLPSLSVRISGPSPPYAFATVQIMR
jgi:hypothetical protein